MSIVIHRWRQKPVFIEEVTVTEENFREVSDWLGAGTVAIEYKSGEPPTVIFGDLPSSLAQFSSIRVQVGDSVYKNPEGKLTIADVESLKKKFKRV